MRCVLCEEEILEGQEFHRLSDDVWLCTLCHEDGLDLGQDEENKTPIITGARWPYPK